MLGSLGCHNNIMISDIGYFLILGKPVVFYLGILTYLAFVLTALIGYLSFRGQTFLPFDWHPRIAVTALVLATIHGLLAISVYFGL